MSTYMTTPDGKAPTHGSVVTVHTPGGFYQGSWSSATNSAYVPGVGNFQKT